MRKLPDCPKCGEDELWLAKWPKYVIVKCYWCGEVATIHPRPTEDEMDAAIANAVEQRQPDAGAKEANGEHIDNKGESR